MGEDEEHLQNWQRPEFHGQMAIDQIGETHSHSMKMNNDDFNHDPDSKYLIFLYHCY